MKVEFEIEAAHGFNLYEFYREFKKQQNAGYFQKVKSIHKLNIVSEKVPVNNDGEFIIATTEDMGRFGVR